MNPLGEFSCLFEELWKADSNNDKLICGKWAEDQSTYVLEVPFQLRDTIIKLQNVLCVKYDEIEECRKKLARLEQEASAFLEVPYSPNFNR